MVQSVEHLLQFYSNIKGACCNPQHHSNIIFSTHVEILVVSESHLKQTHCWIETSIQVFCCQILSCTHIILDFCHLGLLMVLPTRVMEVLMLSSLECIALLTMHSRDDNIRPSHNIRSKWDCTPQSEKAIGKMARSLIMWVELGFGIKKLDVWFVKGLCC